MLTSQRVGPHSYVWVMSSVSLTEVLEGKLLKNSRGRVGTERKGKDFLYKNKAIQVNPVNG
jgi:hypothetical protein